ERARRAQRCDLLSGMRTGGPGHHEGVALFAGAVYCPGRAARSSGLLPVAAASDFDRVSAQPALVAQGSAVHRLDGRSVCAGAGVTGEELIGLRATRARPAARGVALLSFLFWRLLARPTLRQRSQRCRL